MCSSYLQTREWDPTLLSTQLCSDCQVLAKGAVLGFSATVTYLGASAAGHFAFAERTACRSACPCLPGQALQTLAQLPDVAAHMRAQGLPAYIHSGNLLRPPHPQRPATAPPALAAQVDSCTGLSEGYVEYCIDSRISSACACCPGTVAGKFRPRPCQSGLAILL